MRKYINRKLYDTETAHEVGSYEHLYPSDFRWFEETLYRKRSGEYFIHGEGGPASRYAECVGCNSWTGGERIVPVSADEARDWAEKHLDADQVEAEWGEPAEDGRESVNVWVSPAAKQALVAACERTGETRAQVVERLLTGLS